MIVVPERKSAAATCKPKHGADVKRTVPTVYVVNAAALTKPHAIEQLTADLTGYSIDVAFVSETHLKHKHNSDTFGIPDYTLIRLDRSGRRGGVAIYAKQSLQPTLWSQTLDNDHIELLWVGTYNNRTHFFGCVYHPPKPIYQPDILLDILEQSTIDIQVSYPHAEITIAGDFNQLSDASIVDKTGLVPIVKDPTRGTSFLDRIYTSDIHYENIKVVKSCVRSDHYCIVAYSGNIIECYKKERRVCDFRQHTPSQKAAFLQNEHELDVNSLQNIADTQLAFDSFYDSLLLKLNTYFPLRKITLTDRDPEYITPAVKAMLRKKNHLMRQSKLEEADALAGRIEKAIVKYNTASLTQCSARFASSDMWTKVRRLQHATKPNQSCQSVSALSLNAHFTKIASDPHYIAPNRKATVSPSVEVITEYQIFTILDTLPNTATGLDMLPSWFLKLAAPLISSSLTHLVNQSILTSTVPAQWKNACITPLPKISHPADPSDFRPISITPVLSRAIERCIVRKFLYPCFNFPPPTLSFADQFAFRPSGSTTAAIISTLDIIANLLTSNPHVHLIALDFSKAFDSIRHSTLLEKMAFLDMPDYIYNWLTDYFEGHLQCTRYSNSVSPLQEITASVIQGSAVGPASFLVCASDLHPVHQGNRNSKYADDVYLIIPASNSHTRANELSKVSDWASKNNLKLNTSKSQEMIIFSSQGKLKANLHPPPPLENITKWPQSSVRH